MEIFLKTSEPFILLNTYVFKERKDKEVCCTENDEVM